MITAADLHHVLTAIVPLYVAMILAYGSVKWWRIFSPDQCSGINCFVALFAVLPPLVPLHLDQRPLRHELPLHRRRHAPEARRPHRLGHLDKNQLPWLLGVDRDSVLACHTSKHCGDGHSLIGRNVRPGLREPDGPNRRSPMHIWYTLMLFLFEYRGAKLLIIEQFPDTAGSIVSFRVDSDIISLDGKEPLQTEAEVREDGEVHVTVRKSASSRSEICSRRSHGTNSGVPITPRPSNLSNAEIYSLQSSINPTPRGSRFDHADFYSMVNGRNAGGVSPGHSNFGSGAFDEEMSMAAGFPKGNGLPDAGLFSPEGAKKKDLHMFVWSSSALPASDRGIGVFRGAEFGNEHGGAAHHPTGHHPKGKYLVFWFTLYFYVLCGLKI